MLKALREQVAQANIELIKTGLVTLQFGNASGFDRDLGMMVIGAGDIKNYELKPENMVVVDLDGKLVEGNHQPHHDAPTHLELYKAFKNIGGITHTHSPYATMFAQACRVISCLGTMHADFFFGDVPVTRTMTRKEFEEDYEGNTGKVIVERFSNLDPAEQPGVLVAHHGPFTWGKTPMDSVDITVVLEQIAKLAYGTLEIDEETLPIPLHLMEKHFYRRHPRPAPEQTPEPIPPRRPKKTTKI